MNSTEHANAERHYITIVLALLVGIPGVYLRFADFPYNVIVANILLVIGVVIALKGVFGILK